MNAPTDVLDATAREGGPTSNEHDEPGGTPLRRSQTRRLISGVAGGIAERFDVEVSLVRVAFVVLACAWGLGVVIYAAMWALVPAAPGGDGAEGRSVRPTSPWLSMLLLGGVLCFGLLVATSLWVGPRWGGGLGLLWLVLIAALLVLVLHNGSGRWSIGRALCIMALGVVTIAIAAVGSFVGLVASTGVPMTGGIGDRIYQPTSLAELQPAYRAAIGTMTVDLRQVRFPRSTTKLTATVAVGTLTVDVPSGVTVDVSAHAGVGSVASTPDDLQAFSHACGTTGVVRPLLVLVVGVGVGQIHLMRESAPFTSTTC